MHSQPFKHIFATCTHSNSANTDAQTQTEALNPALCSCTSACNLGMQSPGDRGGAHQKGKRPASSTYSVMPSDQRSDS